MKKTLYCNVGELLSISNKPLLALPFLSSSVVRLFRHLLAAREEIVLQRRVQAIQG